MWGSPTSLCSSLSSQPSSTPRHHSLAPAGLLPAAVIYRLGEVSVCWCIWTIRAHFPLERGSSPFVFQSGLGQALPAASWLAGRPHPGPLPYSLSVSTLLSPSFIFFFPFLSPLPYPPRLWKSSSDFPGLLNGEKAEGTLAPSPTSAFPVLLGLETPQEGGDGVSSQLQHPHGLRAAPMPPSLPQGRGKKVASSYPTQTCIPCVDV